MLRAMALFWQARREWAATTRSKIASFGSSWACQAGWLSLRCWPSSASWVFVGSWEIAGLGSFAVITASLGDRPRSFR